MSELEGRRIAILAADGVEQVELEQPRQAVIDAGAQVDLLSSCATSSAVAGRSA